MAVTYKITRTLKLESPKDASTFAKKQHRRFHHIRKEAKKRFAANLNDGDIIDAFANLRKKRERLADEAQKQMKGRTGLKRIEKSEDEDAEPKKRRRAAVTNMEHDKDEQLL